MSVDRAARERIDAPVLMKDRAAETGQPVVAVRFSCGLVASTWFCRLMSLIFRLFCDCCRSVRFAQRARHGRLEVDRLRRRGWADRPG